MPRAQNMLDAQRAKKCLTPTVNEGLTRAGGEGSVVIDVPERLHDESLTTNAPSERAFFCSSDTARSVLGEPSVADHWT
jgi:hypothetical protein